MSLPDHNMRSGRAGKAVAANIAERRKRLGLTQNEVGQRMGLEKETISRIEGGRISVNIERLQEFATLFHCSLQDLLCGASREKRAHAASIAEMLRPLSDDECDVIMRFVADAVRLFSHTPSAPDRHNGEYRV